MIAAETTRIAAGVTQPLNDQADVPGDLDSPSLTLGVDRGGVGRRAGWVREAPGGVAPPDGDRLVDVDHLMEGPYLSTEDTARGSQEAAYLRKPSLDELLRLMEASEGSIRKMTIAPELEGAVQLIRKMAGRGIVPSAGHSTATHEQALEAVAAGLSCATHTFNGMLPLHHRRPGLLGAVLTNGVIRAEVIANGEHVSPPAMELLVRCKGIESVHIVTDSTL